jgi:4-hydroxy-tetrahydrodipicolinate reductase
MIRIVLVGASGRMGMAITSASQGAADVEIVARVDLRENLPTTGGEWTADAASVIQPGTVVVEFSTPAGAVSAAALCAARGVPLVSGSTGLAAPQEEAVRAAGASVAVLRASNFSIGIAALRRALAAALQAVPAGWDVEIIERHHRLKKDSPSGTAVTLAGDVLAARGLGGEVLRYGREGMVGARPAAEVGVHSVRGGTWVGDHAILLGGDGETLELRHVAQDRSAFAHGALAAARFVAGAAPGLYGLDDAMR